MEAAIREIVKALTLEEKAALTAGADAWHTVGVERLAVPAVAMNDGPHGLRKTLDGVSLSLAAHPATCFPTSSAMGSSWDTGLIEQIGQAIAGECLAGDVQILLGPGVNIKRTPLCGRNFEYYSEDPVLAGELGAAFVRGVQSRGVGTSLKHFACNNQEFERMTMSSELDERTMREIYLTAFERVVKKAAPMTVMASYNKVGGTTVTEHAGLLRHILKEEWGFEGLVVSDWGAVTDRPAAIAAGLDLEMPSPGPEASSLVVRAVKEGRLSEADLDEAVGRILRVAFNTYAARRPATTVDPDAHHALARRAAAECVVLLKNEGALLPLRPEALRSVAVIGQFAKNPKYQGGGSSLVNSTRVDVAYDELARLLDGKVDLRYADGYPSEDRVEEALLQEAAAVAAQADVAVLFVGLPESYESEGWDRHHLNLPPAHIRLIEAVCRVQPRTVVVLANGSAVAMPWVDGPEAILEGWLSGQAAGGAVADVLLGVVNPSGKLQESFPMRLEDTPAFLNYPGEEGRVRYGEGIFVGYRHYEKVKVKPLFPFGHGISYTDFAYSDLRLSKPEVTDQEKLEVAVTVKNTGDCAGKEVVQLYVRDVEARVARPVKELKAFAKVSLEPGEAREVHLTLEGRDFAYYSTERQAWCVESGEFEILVGSSSEAILQTATVMVRSTQPEPAFTAQTLLKRFQKSPVAMQVLMQAFGSTPAVIFFTDPVLAGLVQDLPVGRLVNMSRGLLTEENLQQIISAVNQSTKA